MASSIFKKSSPNDRITLYMQNRTFTISDAIDGVIMFDPRFVEDRKIFCQLILNFRYGREKDEIMGLQFYKEFILSSVQVYPPLEKNRFTHTEAQDSLIVKHGPGNTFPFLLHFPDHSPISVILQTGKGDEKSKPCGIHYYIRVFIGKSEIDRPHKRNSINFDIRQVQPNYYQQFLERKQPYSLISQNFIICTGDVELETSLNKRIFHYGEKIPVNIIVRNNSSKIVKKIKMILYQKVEATLIKNIKFTRILDKYSSKSKHLIRPGATYQTVLHTLPSLSGNEHKQGIALESNFKHEKAKLSSTTVETVKTLNNNLGIAVSYFIKVQLVLGPLHSITTELPFVLSHFQTDVDNTTAKKEITR